MTSHVRNLLIINMKDQLLSSASTGHDELSINHKCPFPKRYQLLAGTIQGKIQLKQESKQINNIHTHHRIFKSTSECIK